MKNAARREILCSDGSPMSAALVLIIDDDFGTRDALGGLLRALGYTVKTFASAKEFLDWDGRGTPCCMIVDYAMPGMNGLELQHQLKLEGNRSPVIFLSATDIEVFRNQALEAGACGVFMKPRFEPVLDCLKVALATVGGS